MPRTPTRRIHLERETLRQFIEGRPTGAAQDDAVERHLREGCVSCLFAARELVLEQAEESRRALTAGLFEHRNGSDALLLYGTRLERKILLINLESYLAAGLAAELMLRPAPARREAVRKSRRYQLLGLCEAFRDESRREGLRDVARAVELAELAVEVADCLDSSFYGGRLVADERALAYAILGNACRVAGDLFGAERQLRTALDLLAFGSGGPTERAEVLSLLASLRIDQSRFDESVELLKVVASHYGEQGLDRLEGKTLIKMAAAVGTSGAWEESIELLARAIDLLDDEQDARMIFWARHNVVAALVKADRFVEAAESLREIAPLYERFAEDREALLRKRRVEGLIAAGLGQLVEAENALLEVRARLSDQDRAFDCALVTLDLAALYLDQGRTDEVKGLAEEMYPIFRSQDVHRQALAALVLFKQAALSEAVSVGFVRDVAKYLDRARNNPYLVFQPSNA